MNFNFSIYKRKLSIKVDSFFCRIKSEIQRKMLQKSKYITELLNICYIYMNSIDH